MRSEWTKLRTLPSTVWSLLTTVGLVVGVGAVYALLPVTRPPRQPADLSAFDPTAVSLAGVQLAQFAIGVLGVLLITGEYATGTIRASFGAAAGAVGKGVVAALTTLGLCVPATFAAFLVGQSILSSEHLDVTLGDPGTARCSACCSPPDHRRLPAQHLVRPALQVPSRPGRGRHHQRATRPRRARPVDRVRPVCRLHRGCAGHRRPAAPPPGRMTPWVVRGPRRYGRRPAASRLTPGKSSPAGVW